MNSKNSCYTDAKRKITYQYLKSRDEHIVRILDWIEDLDEIRYKIASSEMDGELEDQIENIISRLTNEVGWRMRGIFT